MARKRKPEEHAHAESWLVSYCDMISLLVTFFLMMMTFSTSSSLDVEEIGTQILSGHGGIWRNEANWPSHEDVPQDVISALAADLRAFLEKRGVDETASIRPTKDGFTIGFDLDSSFAPGADELPRPLADNLVELAPILARYGRQVVLDGFADGAFKPTGAWPDAESIGLARADRAARLLVERGVPAERLLVASPGAARPRADDSTAIGRASNRRLEVRIVSLLPAATSGTEGI